ncbi:MAG: hypothetical protein WCJ35_11775, partial [Planctomycetota bacterium]
AHPGNSCPFIPYANGVMSASRGSGQNPSGYEDPKLGKDTKILKSCSTHPEKNAGFALDFAVLLRRGRCH